MSRHRDVRSMNYTDEYDGYDDVYGHSVEDDYCVSPGAEQFMFDRNKQANIASFFTEPDIVEDNEEIEDISSSYKLPDLSDLDKAKLMSCAEAIKNVIGETLSESELNKKIIEFKYNTEAVLNSILNDDTRSKKDKQPVEKNLVEAQTDSKLKNQISSGSQLNTHEKLYKPQVDTEPTSSFNSLADLAAHNLKMSGLKKPGSGLAIPKMSFNSQKISIDNMNTAATSEISPSFNSLADMTAHHLKISSNNKEDAPKKFGLPSNFVIPKMSLINTQTSSTKTPSFNSLSDLTAHHFKVNEHKLNIGEKKITANSFIIPKLGSKDLKSEKCNIPPFGSPPGFNIKTEKNVDTPDLASMPEVLVKVKEEVNENIPQISNFILEDISNLNIDEKHTSSKMIKTEVKSVLANVKIENMEKPNYNKQPTELLELTIETIKKECFQNSMKYSHKTVSAFGKVLCKKYKRKTPYKKNKIFIITGDGIDRFDFNSVPSPDNLILSRLHRTKPMAITT